MRNLPSPCSFHSPCWLKLYTPASICGVASHFSSCCFVFYFQLRNANILILWLIIAGDSYRLRAVLLRALCLVCCIFESFFKFNRMCVCVRMCKRYVNIYDCYDIWIRGLWIAWSLIDLMVHNFGFSWFSFSYSGFLSFGQFQCICCVRNF